MKSTDWHCKTENIKVNVIVCLCKSNDTFYTSQFWGLSHGLESRRYLHTSIKPVYYIVHHWCYGFWNHKHLDCLFNELLTRDRKKHFLLYWPFVRRNHQWLLTNGQLCEKCSHDVIISSVVVHRCVLLQVGCKTDHMWDPHIIGCIISFLVMLFVTLYWLVN